MRPSFLAQLSQYENKLYVRGIGPKTQRWTELSDNHIQLENEELIVRNTYLNSQMAPLADLNLGSLEEKTTYTLKWVDESRKKPLTEENLDDDDLVNLVNPSPIKHHRESHRLVKPIVKGSRQKQRASSQQPPHSASSLLGQGTGIGGNSILNNQSNNNLTKSKFLAKTSIQQTQNIP